MHDAAVLRTETSYPFRSWTRGRTLHVLLNLNYGFIPYVIKVPLRAFMMCAVSRMEFPSEPLGLLVSGRVTGRWRKHDCASHPSSVAFTHMRPTSHADICATRQTQWTWGCKCCHYCLVKDRYGLRLPDEKLGRQTCRSNLCWNIPSYSWTIMRNQCKFFFRIVNRYAAAVHLPSTNAYQSLWQRRDTACVCCYCL